MGSIIYALEVECESVVARVVLNEIDVFSEWEGARRITQTKLNPYIVEQSNRLEVLVTPMTDDNGDPVPAPYTLRVALIRGEHGVAPDDANRIAQFTWNPAEFPAEPGVLTGVWARQFTVRPEQAFGRWLWQDAPAAMPREDDARELVALCEIVHGALSRRDVATVMTLTELRTMELARALDVPLDEARAEQAEMLNDWFSAPGWTLTPFDPGALAASPFARGKLVRVTDPYGAAPIHGTDGERPFAFAFTATRVAGSWAIVR
ncbi:MAG: hypothetical protein U0326_38615 [Polyangiales bacterium]